MTKNKTLAQKINRFTISLLAVFAVFLIVWFVFGGTSTYNVNSIWKVFFVDSITNTSNYPQYLKLFAAFLMAALATAICFRAGFFNLNVPGQMAASALSVFLFGQLLNRITPGGSYYWIPLLIMIGCITAVLFALFIAFLKVVLDVNEVATTIFLNFIIFYCFTSVVRSPYLVDPTTQLQTHPDLDIGLSTSFNIQFWFIPLSCILAILIYAFFCFLITKTRFGFQLKILDKAEQTVKFSGVSKNANIYKIFILSGILAGLAGFFFYYRSPGSATLNFEDALPANGWDAISIIWLSNSSLLGIPFFTLLISVIRIQSRYMFASQLNPAAPEIIFGLLLLVVGFINAYYDDLINKFQNYWSDFSPGSLDHEIKPPFKKKFTNSNSVNQIMSNQQKEAILVTKNKNKLVIRQTVVPNKAIKPIKQKIATNIQKKIKKN